MNAAQIINWLSEIDISIQLQGDNLLVDHKSPLTNSQVKYLKQHKPELVTHLKSLSIKIVDIYNRRQCLSCEWWALERCNHSYYISYNAWGETMYYTPDSEQWIRCKYHSKLSNH